MKYLIDILTSRDNATFSASKLIGISAAFAAIYEFLHLGSADFAGFCGGIALLIGAYAAKNFTDAK